MTDDRARTAAPARPHVICHMLSSLDGRLHPSRWSRSPDGERGDWTRLYGTLHDAFEGDAWLVGRVTMAEMTFAMPPPATSAPVERPIHVAAGKPDGGRYAVALDGAGKLGFESADIDGDAVIVLLGAGVSDAHLAALAHAGVSYVVADRDDVDLAAALETLRRVFDTGRLLVEGGATINGAVLAAGLVDEISVLVVPAIEGVTDGRSIFEAGTDGLAGKVRLALLDCRTLDFGAVHLRYAVTPA